jgi:putative transposase
MVSDSDTGSDTIQVLNLPLDGRRVLFPHLGGAAMGRPTRVFLPNVPLHVVQRGHNLNFLFFSGADYRRYLDWLREAVAKYGLAVHGYVLMTNHVHLLVTPEHPESLTETLRSLNRRYVQYINHREGWRGTLWEGRCRAAPIDSEAYFLTCLRYVELNPVRAGMVAAPAAYPWSSFRHHALGSSELLISAHWTYQKLGHSSRERQQAYVDLVRTALPEDTLKAVRTAAHSGRPLGGRRFEERVARMKSCRTPAPTRFSPKKES